MLALRYNSGLPRGRCPAGFTMPDQDDSPGQTVLPSEPQDALEMGSDIDAMRIAVVVAILISYVLGPAVTSMHKRGIPRLIGSFIVIALLCGGIGFGVYTLTDEPLAIVDNVPTAARRLAARFESRSGE